MTIDGSIRNTRKHENNEKKKDLRNTFHENK